VLHPETRILQRDTDWRSVARELGFPLVIKPARGAGCEGVHLARTTGQLRSAVAVLRRTGSRRPLLLQRYVPGVAASVSLLADGVRAMALAVNGQTVSARRDAIGNAACSAARPFSYRGGRTPLDHPQAMPAIEAALRTCHALPGLRGYVGVDLVLTRSEAIVIEVNPRLTTAYLGVRATLRQNVAGLALAACAGSLPRPPVVRRTVRFTASGRIGSASVARSGARRA
jgi:predicted ATP-grasp superfamily ATP-dependent carboligase